jgi:hypothetical protein
LTNFLCFNDVNEREKLMNAPVVFPVSNKSSSFLAFRSKAREVRQDLEELIANERAVALIIDFDGVEAMTISFTDEFLGKFQSGTDRAQDGMTVMVTGLNEETQEAVQIALERRKTFVAGYIEGEPQLLGSEDFLNDTYRACRELGEFRAADLATRLGITSQNANNRLTRLIAAGAVQRVRAPGLDRGGKEFAYRTGHLAPA